VAAGQLDDHMLTAFIPADRIGRDGRDGREHVTTA
jgi:hypothetical protein